MENLIQERLYLMKNLLKMYMTSNDLDKDTVELFLEEITILKQNNLVFSSKEQIKKIFEKESDYMEAMSVIDGIEMEYMDNNICPISKQEINEKYIASCGHVFEKSAFLPLLRSRRIVCPVSGCSKMIS